MTTNTSQAIIEKAYADSMKLPRGGVLTSAQLTDGLERLQDIVNLEATLGLKLFLETEVVLSLTVNKQVYSFRPGGDVSMPRPLRVKDAVYVASGGQSRSLIPMGRTDWAQQTARNDAGTINLYFAERLHDRLNLYFWNKPDVSAATGTVRVTLHVAATTLTLALNTHYPPEWVMFLRWALCADLASGMPVEVIQRAEQKAQQYRSILEAFDVEDAPTRLQPTYPRYNPSEFSS